MYEIIKIIHILSATLLFGTGLGTAFFFFQAQRNEGLSVRLFAARTTVLADFVFTLPAVILQPLSGVWLMRHGGYGWDEPWLLVTYGIYILAGLCWVPVVVIQIKLRSILRRAETGKTALPPAYDQLFRWWYLLGWPAFMGLVVVFFLMVMKPSW